MGALVGSLFVSCGETSGDQYASALISALREEGFSGQVWGMTGKESSSSGAEQVWSMDELRLIGVSEVLWAVPRLLRLKRSITRRILSENPSVVIVVDSPDFHLPLLAGLKKGGFRGRTVYLCPPTVWAWRSSRTEDLRRLCDLCLPLFGFEHQYLVRHGIPSRWTGHPLKDQLEGFTPDALLKERLAGRTAVGLLPGSRPGEIQRLLPPLLEAGRRLREGGLHPVVSLAPFLPEGTRRFVRDQAGDFDIFEGSGRHLLALSSAAAGASGTAAVESLLLGTFMVVLYKASFSSWLAWKLFGKTPWISIPNILAGEQVFPELLQGRAKPENVFASVSRFLADGSFRRRTESLMGKAREGLGAGGAVKAWARSIMELMER